MIRLLITTLYITVFAWVILLGTNTSFAQSSGQDQGILQARIQAAQQRAITFLRSQIDKDGRCLGEYDQSLREYGGKTGLCVYALLSAGVDHRQPDIQRALNWLLRTKFSGTYAVSMRACALAEVKDERVRQALVADVAWLIKAASANGAYTYTSSNGDPATKYDNSNAQMAVLGVWAGARRGVSVPAQYWQNVERYWQEQQQVGGGWGYLAQTTGRTKTYGSMSAAGLATLFICFDNLHRDEFIRCTATSDPKPIADGLKWLGENFRADENPKIGTNHYGYWLYALERAGQASGYKYFGGHDWYSKCAAELLLRQNAYGSWDYGSERLSETALSLLFLAGGRNPLVMSKLRYEGKWNARPRDLSNFSLYLGDTFEQPYRWQVVDLQAPMGDWHDAPILYISGAGAVDFTDPQVDKLRTFVQQGGSIVSESACSSADFTLDIKRLYKRMFPALELSRLGDDHPVYSIHFPTKERRGLMGLHNGVRMLAIHCPQELSLSLQLGANSVNTPTFELATNIFYLLTDKGQLNPGGYYWPLGKAYEPVATIKLARIKYSGNYDVEPLAWHRLAILMGNLHQVKLEVSEPLDAAELDAKVYPIAAITGTAAFTLSDKQAQGIRKYLAQGGRLIVEACAGSREFADSAKQQIFPLYPQGQLGTLVSSHPFYRGPQRLDKVAFRSEYAGTLGAARSEVRLQALMDGQRVAVVFSGEDLTAGLLGANIYRLKGYTPEVAISLMTNILCNLAGIKMPAEPKPISIAK